MRKIIILVIALSISILSISTFARFTYKEQISTTPDSTSIWNQIYSNIRIIKGISQTNNMLNISHYAKNIRFLAISLPKYSTSLSTTNLDLVKENIKHINSLIRRLELSAKDNNKVAVTNNLIELNKMLDDVHQLYVRNNINKNWIKTRFN